ncbi:dihydroorotase [Acetatifactor muris]|uniref:Dihydroorotase n=1 Tax=Acetatifactor muris TaxID=879566 RepID=A0A2K4ZJU4_9FIRM|nr:dihydroorotase [Acetatifactor muris]MCR2049113.1 dihydroorotase [Acetatifactor muris]SOY30739.1 Dihydroorotase [Acetatifactor muris]
MLLIRNGYVIDPKSGVEGKYDILTDGDKIRKIGKNLERPDDRFQVIDAEGLLVAPGLVDVHVHFRDPGFPEKEDILTGAAAAAAGGFTTVVLMANTRPPVDNRETLTYVLEKGRSTGIHVLSCANVTLGMQGRELTPMEELAAAGAAGFTDDGIPLLDETLVRDAMKRAAALDMPISFHEEDPALISDNGVNRGKASTFFGIGGSPREAEITLTGRDLELALETGACINIQHISAKESVELVRQAKKRGANIHAEATPHHFMLTEEAAIQYGTLAKMNPPLREEADRLAIIQGLADGTIDIIATDHAPHTAKEKERDITKAPSGIIGLETALSLAITGLVNEGRLTMGQLLRLMSTNPAGLYHLNAGFLAENGPADIILIDTAADNVPGKYVSKASNTPFTGWKLKGKVVKTIAAGRVVYSG